ncbi:MarR family transcriptional regulator [Frankia sp. Cr1]|uniref:MarR family winged helix-turn-helix transcriptional regulator n=1 Tax=Frankia sp. Cr1 TaxID=3073931 RepID=UPI002AD20006|nr:MarR family transcriptional regulator [Frankia sp. Cr1]
MAPPFLPPEAARLVLGGGSLLHRTARELNTALERSLAPFDVTAQQAALLLRLRSETSPHRLAAALGTDTAGMTRLLDRLEDKGLVSRVRHPSDRRSVRVELTAAGATLTPRLAPVFGSVIRRLFDGFSTDDLQQLSVMLQRMFNNLTSSDT